MVRFLSAFAALLFIAGCSAINELGSTESSSSAPSESTEVENLEIEDIEVESTEVEGTDAEVAAAENAEGEEEGINQKNVRLVVKDQTTAGQIVIEEVATARDGWVSIHQSNEDGGIELPDSLGQARVDAGDSEDVVVDLWEAPYPEEKLWVLLHIDSGDRGIYEFPGADVAVKKNGETMARSFYIKEDSEEGE
ncbi:hypothetical protein [cf. Phormidesmis sp. LEGE 11477]|uniref:DUF7282 domain-containing protein n=1 Tax=cf. Phormidesmis sp. LEGE 11477 TaxID=1828680 RepID=UPI0018830369|nr:hypothetical protein [cf. Phormidesmis sp. LEGE 11477]MBE9060574.1 hypothetical protein [cf. Phormidesmis sp. LEGE 11477]